MSRERMQMEIQRHLDALYAEGKKDSATMCPREVLHHTLLLERALMSVGIIPANARHRSGEDQDDLEKQI
jgi:hypothetical protein